MAPAGLVIPTEPVHLSLVSQATLDQVGEAVGEDGGVPLPLILSWKVYQLGRNDWVGQSLSWVQPGLQLQIRLIAA